MQQLSKNFSYFRRHFSDLAKRHGGQMIVISGGRLLGACKMTQSRTLAKLVGRARRIHPRDVPFVSPVPTAKDLATGFLI